MTKACHVEHPHAINQAALPLLKPSRANLVYQCLLAPSSTLAQAQMEETARDAATHAPTFPVAALTVPRPPRTMPSHPTTPRRPPAPARAPLHQEPARQGRVPARDPQPPDLPFRRRRRATDTKHAPLSPTAPHCTITSMSSAMTH